MKNIVLAAALIAAASTVSANEADREGLYGGVGVGIMNIDIHNADRLYNGTLQMGYHFNNNLALELQYTDSLTEGDINYNYGYYRSSVSYSVQTLAAYGVYRSSGDVYFKGKAGVLREKVLSAKDTGVSAGVGVGFRISDSAALEFEATIIEKDINFFSAAINFGF